MRYISICFVAVSMFTATANAAISLDRTRVVFDEGGKSVNLNIVNENKNTPYLAQSWMESADHKKINRPFIITPPIQRLEPGGRSIIRVAVTPEVSVLPKDRESLFYFNLREIPPRSEKSNVMQLALQTQVKFFYRPVSLTENKGKVWQEAIVIMYNDKGYNIENPTPYYVTLVGLRDKKDAGVNNKNLPIMIAPFGREFVISRQLSVPVITYINDYGGQLSIIYHCVAHSCFVDKQEG